MKSRLPKGAVLTRVCEVCNTVHGPVCSRVDYRGYRFERVAADALAWHVWTPGGSVCVQFPSYGDARSYINALLDGPRERTQVRQWPVGDQLATTVHHLTDDGEETIALSGVYPRLDLSVESERARGHETVLSERARADHR